MGRRARTLPALVLSAVLALASALLASCAAQESQPPDLVPITFGVSQESLSALGYVARDHGCFEQAGLDVEFVEYSSSQLSMDALLSGEADAILSADTPIVLSALAGSELRVIATVGTDANDLKIVSRSDAGVAQPSDLLGKRVGTRRGTAAHFFLHTFLIKHGMSDDDVTLVFDSFENVTGALESGQVDAVSLRQPFISQLRRSLGEGFVLFEEEGLYGKTMNLCVRAGADAPDPEVQRRLVRAMLLAEQAAMTGPTAEIRADVERDIGLQRGELCDCIIVDGAVGLRQSLVLVLEDQARWAIDSGIATPVGAPDMLALLDPAAMEAVAPERVSIIR